MPAAAPARCSATGTPVTAAASAIVARGPGAQPVESAGKADVPARSAETSMLDLACAPRDLVGIAIRHRREHGLNQDAQIEPDRPIIDVVEVVLDALSHLVVGVGFTAKSMDLRPAGDAGYHVVPAGIERNLALIVVVVRQRVRARAVERHGAGEHVEQLGNFIDVPTTQPAPEPGNAGIVTHRLTNLVAIVERS